MSKLYRKVELTANIFMIVTALLIGGIFVKKYFLDKPIVSGEAARLQPAIGSKIDLAEVNWANQPKTLILVLRKGCRFCTESAPL